MRIRADSAFVSGILFTIALSSLIPAALRNALGGSDKALLARMDEVSGRRPTPRTISVLPV